jgi:hypothetical protein
MNHPSSTIILLLLGFLVSGSFSASRIRDPKSNQCLEGFLSKTLRLFKCDKSNPPPHTMTTHYQTWYVANNGQISNAQIGQYLADGLGDRLQIVEFKMQYLHATRTKS